MDELLVEPTLTVIPLRATVKLVMPPVVESFWIGSAIREPWYLEVSIPPNRIEPVLASRSFNHKL